MFPEDHLETARLVLRQYRADDATDVALACRDELIQRWLPLPNPYTDADALAWCAAIAPGFRASGEGIEWAAVRRADDRLIGSFGLKRTDWRARSSEIVYWVAPWARGEGLAVEAVTAIARWLLEELRFERLVLRAATGNVASQRVAERAGLTREGVARNAGFNNAGRVDLVVFSLVPADLDRTDRPPSRVRESESVMIRRCRQDDIDQVAHLAILMGNTISEEDVVNRIGLIQERHEHLLCVAEVKGAILGYAWAQDYGPHLRSGDSVVRIHDLFVRTGKRRHGIGSALFSYARTWAIERGVTYIQWQASPTALPFYRSLGLAGDPCPDPDHPFFEIILEGGTGRTR